METDVLVVGGGATGLAAARSLAPARRVLLVDPWPLHNDLNASNDESKFFRVAYGGDDEYARMALAAGALWDDLAREARSDLLGPRGLLLVGNGAGSYVERSVASLDRVGAPAQPLTRDELARRFPAWRAAPYAQAALDPTSALLDARPALAALEASATARGATVLRGVETVAIREGPTGIVAELSNGGTVQAGRAILATGFRTSRLVPSAGKALAVSRQVELFLAPPDPGAYEAARFPLWMDVEGGFYGFPWWRGAVKVADHRRGRLADPEAPRGAAEPADEAAAREFLRACLPELAEAPLARSRVCLYDNTTDEHFLLGPIGERVVLAAGLSGHGIKFAPLLGELAASLALGEAPRFDLARHSPARYGVTLAA